MENDFFKQTGPPIIGEGDLKSRATALGQLDSIRDFLREK